MGRGWTKAVKDKQEVGMRKGGLALDRGSKSPHTTSHSP
jgi:hypothetical protein